MRRRRCRCNWHRALLRSSLRAATGAELGRGALPRQAQHHAEAKGAPGPGKFLERFWAPCKAPKMNTCYKKPNRKLYLGALQGAQKAFKKFATRAAPGKDRAVENGSVPALCFGYCSSF